VVLLDDVKIYLRAILEAAKAESVQRIQSQLPEIEKALRAIKVNLEINESSISQQVSSFAQSATKEVKSQSKQISSALNNAFKGIDVRLLPQNSREIETEMRRIVGVMTKAQGEMKGFSLLADKNEDIKGAL
jgi:transposase